jgi:hypothetical protein
MTGIATRADRGDKTVRVLLGTERFSSKHRWSELTALMPGGLQATVAVQACPPGSFVEHARDGSIDVVVPLWAEFDAETIQAGQFGPDSAVRRRRGPRRVHEQALPASAPLARHPKVIATAHNAALTTSYTRSAGRALGDGLAAYLDGRRPPNTLDAPSQPR